MVAHPYTELPAYTRWARSVADKPTAEVDPVVDFPFTISATDKVATAGSCFAQHIARHLRKNGFNYYVVEDGHPIAEESTKQAFNYGVFSARYGNIYTSRQLLQLCQRAYGEFRPIADYWRSPKVEGFIDPFRPTIQPNGFSTLAELRADRVQHLSRVRQMLETLDYLVFTLGLTEMWFDRSDGAAFPVCPGVAGGEYDDSKVGFHNLSAAEVFADLKAALNKLFSVNPGARVILTVSPVPLAATALHRHVLTSTTYSKAVLRVASEEVCGEFQNCAYFPSYEVITGQYARGSYFANDLRSVTEDGVEHVMRLFLKHATDLSAAALPKTPAETTQGNFIAEMSRVVQALCDEELLEPR